MSAEQQAETDRLMKEGCKCGHARICHGDRVGGLAKGHGICFVSGCRCCQFTWVTGDLEAGDGR